MNRIPLYTCLALKVISGKGLIPNGQYRVATIFAPHQPFRMALQKKSPAFALGGSLTESRSDAGLFLLLEDILADWFATFETFFKRMPVRNFIFSKFPAEKDHSFIDDAREIE